MLVSIQHLLPLLVLLPSTITALALPSKPLPRDQIQQRQETWDIPRLDMHILSKSTGIPGNPPWPADRIFNSTIDFDAILPRYVFNSTTDNNSGDSAALVANMTVNCKASFKNGTLPVNMVACTGTPANQPVSFGMMPYKGAGADRRPELSFVLIMGRALSGREGVGSIPLSGGTPITANDAANEPTSYLTCLEGPPFDGLRCKIRSYMSVNKELVIEATPKS